MPTHGGNQSPVEFGIDASDFLKTGKVLKQIDDKSVLKSLRAGLRAAAAPIKDQAKSNASFSSDIQKSITVETAFTAKKSGVFIVAKRNKMPAGKEALPGLMERGQKGARGGSFRHPVFGNEDVWVEQDGHPFLAPAIAGQDDKVADAIREEIVKAIKASGLTDTN